VDQFPKGFRCLFATMDTALPLCPLLCCTLSTRLYNAFLTPWTFFGSAGLLACCISYPYWSCCISIGILLNICISGRDHSCKPALSSQHYFISPLLSLLLKVFGKLQVIYQWRRRQVLFATAKGLAYLHACLRQKGSPLQRLFTLKDLRGAELQFYRTQ